MDALNVRGENRVGNISPLLGLLLSSLKLVLHLIVLAEDITEVTSVRLESGGGWRTGGL